jgi:hypothetical protein
MRLATEQAVVIRGVVRETLGPDARVRRFGSRTDDFGPGW